MKHVVRHTEYSLPVYILKDHMSLLGYFSTPCPDLIDSIILYQVSQYVKTLEDEEQQESHHEQKRESAPCKGSGKCPILTFYARVMRVFSQVCRSNASNMLLQARCSDESTSHADTSHSRTVYGRVGEQLDLISSPSASLSVCQPGKVANKEKVVLDKANPTMLSFPVSFSLNSPGVTHTCKR